MITLNSFYSSTATNHVRHIQTDTYRQTNRQINRQTEREEKRETKRHMTGQTDRDETAVYLVSLLEM